MPLTMTKAGDTVTIRKITGKDEVRQHLDAGEFLDVVKMPFDEALGLVMDGTIKDSKTQVALLKYAQLRAKV